MLIDLHGHTSGISRCCRATNKEVIETSMEKGIDGMVLCNHFQKSYLDGITKEEFVKAYIREFEETKKIGDEKGFKVYFGIEVTMERANNIHLLIYGVEPCFIEKHPEIYDYSLDEIYEAVKEDDGLLVQAHPFRNGATVMDTNFLDGIEINCHPGHEYANPETLIEIAKENDLLITCGGDYHADEYRPVCGMYIKEDIEGIRELKEYIIAQKELLLSVHTPFKEIVKMTVANTFKKERGMKMYLIAGLGNPGRDYVGTRHNIGFEAIDGLCAKFDIKLNKEKFRAIYGEGRIGGEKVLVVKPQTYMNLSGESIREIRDYYKIDPENIIIIYDDISLPLGKIRIREKGSAGGHNGIKNIIYQLNSDVFPRIKIGVGAPEHPDYDIKDFVLGRFSDDEVKILIDSVIRVASAVEEIIKNDPKSAMNKYNG